jgi:hypothetical protein
MSEIYGRVAMTEGITGCRDNARVAGSFRKSSSDPSGGCAAHCPRDLGGAIARGMAICILNALIDPNRMDFEIVIHLAGCSKPNSRETWGRHAR